VILCVKLDKDRLVICIKLNCSLSFKYLVKSLELSFYNGYVTQLDIIRRHCSKILVHNQECIISMRRVKIYE